MSTTTQTETEQVTTTIRASTTLTLPGRTLKPSYEELNPRSKPTEFLGPWGTGFISVFAPLWAYFIFYACNETTGCHPRSPSAWKQSFNGLFMGEWPTTAGQWWRWEALGVYLGWYAFCVVCAVVLPGPKVEGTLMRNGKRKAYKMNGELLGRRGASSQIVMFVLLRVARPSWRMNVPSSSSDGRTRNYDARARPHLRVLPATGRHRDLQLDLRQLGPSSLRLARHERRPSNLGLGLQLLLARAPRSGWKLWQHRLRRACLCCVVTGFLPVAARIELIVVVPWAPTQPDLAGFPQLRPQDLQRGPPGYYRLGAAQHRLRVRAVPPQRPSHGQHDPRGALPGMVLTRLALGGGTLSHVPRPNDTDAQSAILNQMDITTDGFGFMLAFGDLVFVPFTYGLQARYLAFTPIDLGLPACAAIVAVKLLGVWAFKGANIEKFDFRNGRNPKSASCREQTTGCDADARLEVHGDGAGYQAPHLGMVGRVAPPELPRRPAHWPFVVAPYRLQHAPDVLLLCVLHHPPRAPTEARRPRLQAEVRQGLGRVLPTRAVQDLSLACELTAFDCHFSEAGS